MPKIYVRYVICPYCRRPLSTVTCANCGEETDGWWPINGICPYCRNRDDQGRCECGSSFPSNRSLGPSKWLNVELSN